MIETQNQLIIEGFNHNANIGPEQTIHFLNEKGYCWLTDLNSGKFLMKTGHEPYIPYRIEFPSGKILDEEEIFESIGKLEKRDFQKKKSLMQEFYIVQ